MYIRALFSLPLFHLFLLIAPVAGASAPLTTQLHYSEACRDWLAPRWENNQFMLNTLVHGSGPLILLTLNEMKNQIGLSPSAKPSYHRSAFALLSPNHDHHFKTPASTYPDNPTRYLTFTKGHEWLATHAPFPPEVIPQHLVIMNHGVDESIVRHEMTHLDDFDEIHDYAVERLGPGSDKILLVRMNVFLILTELHAYRGEFLNMQPSQYAEDLIAITDFTIAPLVADSKKQLSAYDWATLLENLGARDLSRAGIEEYFRSPKPFPAWRVLLKGLGPNVVQEIN